MEQTCNKFMLKCALAQNGGIKPVKDLRLHLAEKRLGNCSLQIVNLRSSSVDAAANQDGSGEPWWSLGSEIKAFDQKIVAEIGLLGAA